MYCCVICAIGIFRTSFFVFVEMSAVADIPGLKVGNFSSPLIRPLQADGLLVLKAENLLQHGAFLKPGGWAVVNGHQDNIPETDISADAIDADTLAQKIENPKSVNLIVLGFALSKTEPAADNPDGLYCRVEDIKAVLNERFAKNKMLLDASMNALQTGYGFDG